MTKREIIKKIVELHNELKIVDDFIAYINPEENGGFDMYEINITKDSLEKAIESGTQELLEGGE